MWPEKELRSNIDRIVEAATDAGGIVVIGGRERRRVGDHRRVFLGSSMAELAAYAHGFCHGAPRSES